MMISSNLIFIIILIADPMDSQFSLFLIGLNMNLIIAVKTWFLNRNQAFSIVNFSERDCFIHILK